MHGIPIPVAFLLLFIMAVIITFMFISLKAVEKNVLNSAPPVRTDVERDEAWSKAASAIDSTYQPPDDMNSPPAITGEYRDHQVSIKLAGRSYIRYFVGFRRAEHFHVCAVRDIESIAARLMEGHPIFPSGMFFPSGVPAFYCSAESEEAFDRFLDPPSRRSAILNLVKLFSACMFNDAGVFVRMKNDKPNPAIVKEMLAIAEAIETPSASAMPDLESLPAAEKSPRIHVSEPPPLRLNAERSRSYSSSNSENDTPKRYAPIPLDKLVPPMQAARPVPAKKPTSKIPPVMQAHPTVVIPLNPQAAAPAPNPTPAPAPAPAPVSAPAPAPALSRSAQSFCEILFSKPFPGEEERRAFESEAGKRIHWSGELQSVSSYSVDFVFGSRNGVKAVFVIAAIPAKFGAPVRIKAVASFPPEQLDSLSAAKGKTLSFDGTLLKFESFSHEIFLKDATLAES